MGIREGETERRERRHGKTSAVTFSTGEVEIETSFFPVREGEGEGGGEDSAAVVNLIRR